MTLQFSAKHCWLLAVLALVTAAPLAEERLIINVSKVKRSPSSSNTIHYQGTGSVRHSEQRTYEKAQSRHSVQAAESRNVSRGPAVATPEPAELDSVRLTAPPSSGEPGG